MIVNMLEAISEMLKNTKETEVKCAKIMLDKVIEAMQADVAATPLLPPPQRVTPPMPKAKRADDEVQIIVEHGKISSIQNAKEDTKLELDGKVYGWQEAIGKSFSEGRVL